MEYKDFMESLVSFILIQNISYHRVEFNLSLFHSFRVIREQVDRQINTNYILNYIEIEYKFEGN